MLLEVGNSGIPCLFSLDVPPRLRATAFSARKGCWLFLRVSVLLRVSVRTAAQKTPYGKKKSKNSVTEEHPKTNLGFFVFPPCLRVSVREWNLTDFHAAQAPESAGKTDVDTGPAEAGEGRGGCIALAVDHQDCFAGTAF